MQNLNLKADDLNSNRELLIQHLQRLDAMGLSLMKIACGPGASQEITDPRERAEAIATGHVPYNDMISLQPIAVDDLISVQGRCFSRRSFRRFLAGRKDFTHPLINPVSQIPLTAADIERAGFDPQQMRVFNPNATTYRKDLVQKVKRDAANNKFSSLEKTLRSFLLDESEAHFVQILFLNCQMKEDVRKKVIALLFDIFDENDETPYKVAVIAKAIDTLDLTLLDSSLPARTLASYYAIVFRKPIDTLNQIINRIPVTNELLSVAESCKLADYLRHLLTMVPRVYRTMSAIRVAKKHGDIQFFKAVFEPYLSEIDVDDFLNSIVNEHASEQEISEKIWPFVEFLLEKKVVVEHFREKKNTSFEHVKNKALVARLVQYFGNNADDENKSFLAEEFLKSPKSYEIMAQTHSQKKLLETIQNIAKTSDRRSRIRSIEFFWNFLKEEFYRESALSVLIENGRIEEARFLVTEDDLILPKYYAAAHSAMQENDSLAADLAKSMRINEEELVLRFLQAAYRKQQRTVENEKRIERANNDYAAYKGLAAFAERHGYVVVEQTAFDYAATIGYWQVVDRILNEPQEYLLIQSALERAIEAPFFSTSGMNKREFITKIQRLFSTRIDYEKAISKAADHDLLLLTDLKPPAGFNYQRALEIAAASPRVPTLTPPMDMRTWLESFSFFKITPELNFQRAVDIAVANGKFAFAASVLSSSANSNLNSQPAVDAAVRNAERKLLTELLNAVRPLEKRVEVANTAMAIAISGGKIDTIKRLAEVSKETMENALEKAIADDNWKIVKSLAKVSLDSQKAAVDVAKRLRKQKILSQLQEEFGY